VASLSRPSTRAATDLHKYAQKLRIAFATLLEPFLTNGAAFPRWPCWPPRRMKRSAT